MKTIVEAGKPIILPDGTVLKPNLAGAPEVLSDEEADAEEELVEALDELVSD